MEKTPGNFVLLTALAILALALPGFAQSELVVTPGNRIVDTSSLYRLEFTLPDTLPSGGAISIVFPQGFDLSHVNLAGSSVIRGGLTTVVSGQEVVVARRGEGKVKPRGAKVDLLLSTIKNPGAAQIGAELSIRILVHENGRQVLSQIRTGTYKPDTNKLSVGGTVRLSPAE